MLKYNLGMDDFELELKQSILNEVDDHNRTLLDILSSHEFYDEHYLQFFRLIHTIKGVSQAANFESMARASHYFEDVLIKMQNYHSNFDENFKNIAYEFCDNLTDAISELKADLNAEPAFDNFLSDLNIYHNNLLNSYERKLDNFHQQENSSDLDSEVKELNNQESVSEHADILIIDDDQSLLDYLSKFIEQNLAVESKCYLNAIDAFSELNTHKFKCIICDYQLPILKGDALVKQLRSSNSINNNVPILFISADKTIELPRLALENVIFIDKPIDKKRLYMYLRMIMVNH